jgi:hypothetical protein
MQARVTPFPDPSHAGDGQQNLHTCVLAKHLLIKANALLACMCVKQASLAVKHRVIKANA